MIKKEKPKIEIIHTPKEALATMHSALSPKPKMKILWERIMESLTDVGYQCNGKRDLFMKYPEVVIIVNLQVSAFDKNDYYINIGFLIRQINDPIKPKFYYDSECFGRISVDDKSVDEVIKEIFMWINKYSRIEDIVNNLSLNKPLYNSIIKLDTMSFLKEKGLILKT